MSDTERIRELAQRWAAEEGGDGLAQDPASDQGWSPCAFLCDSERAELFAWVRREIEREATKRGFNDGPGDREVLAEHVAGVLGGSFAVAFAYDRHAWHLCEAAGWPEVGHE